MTLGGKKNLFKKDIEVNKHETDDAVDMFKKE